MLHWLKVGYSILFKPSNLNRVEKVEKKVVVALYLVYLPVLAVLSYILNLFIINPSVSPLYLAILYMLGVLLSAFIQNIVFYVVSIILGGEGSFLEQFSLYSLWYLPLMVFSTLLLGIIVGQILLYIYYAYLTFLTLKKVHNLKTSYAIISVLAGVSLQLLYFFW